MGGRDGHLYEFYYQHQEGWWGKKTTKVCHTSSNLSWILPGFLGSFTEENPLVQIVIDNTRNILYTRSEKGTVGVFDLGKDGQGLERVITITTQKLVEEASRLVTTVETGNITPIVHLAVVASVEDQMIHLLAVTGGGARLFLTTTTNSTDTRPNTLRLLHVRLPTSAPPQRPVKVQTGFYRSGLALLASSPAEVADVLWVVGSGNMPQGNTVMEGQATVEMEGHVWALDDVVSNSKLDDLFLASFSGRTPCSATQHCTSARKFVMLSAQGAIIVEPGRPVDCLRQLLVECGGTDSCEWDKVMHISDAEKSFRRKSNSKAVQTYFCANGGLLARNLEAKNKGLMTWKKRDTAAERLSVGSMGTIEERICREWDLLDRIVEDDEKFVAIKRLTDILSNNDLEMDKKTKAQVFHALCSIGLAPCVFLKENLLPQGENDFEAVVLVPTFISAVRMKGKMIKVIAEAKSKFLKDLQGKFKEDEEYFLDWLHLRIAERAEWGALDDKLVVVLQTFVPAYIDSIGGWREYKPDWCPKNLHRKLKRDHIRWNEKKQRNSINYWIAGCRMTDIGSELWTVSESVWPDLEEIIIARWMELLQDFPILGVDFEGGGCVGQFAFASQSGISSFVFIGGFFPSTLTRIIMDVSPIIIGGMFELSKYLGGSSGLSSLDPYVILRDAPGMNSSYGIADLAKVCLGLNLHRLKKVGAMCAKNQLSDLTMNELQHGFVRLSDWYQKEVLSNEQSYYAALDAEVLLRAIIMAMWLETALRQFSYTEEVITVSTVVEWWEWARNLKCNQSQLQRVSSTEAGFTARESRLAFLGKIHFFTHARGKEFSEEDRISDGGPLNENVGKENRIGALYDEYGVSRSTLWKRRQVRREQEILRRRGK